MSVCFVVIFLFVSIPPAADDSRDVCVCVCVCVCARARVGGGEVDIAFRHYVTCVRLKE